MGNEIDTMPVIGVLVVEHDATLRESIQDLLHAAGYASVGVGDLDLAWNALKYSLHPLVVLVSHGDTRFPAEKLISAAGMLPCHAYVLLSTSPETAPALRNPHTQGRVPVLALPYDLDRLPRVVKDAVRRLRRGLAERPDHPAGAPAVEALAASH